MTDERRARRGLFTVSVVGGGNEHRLQGVSGLERTADPIESVSGSTQIWVNSLPGHINTGDITLSEAPFAGCAGGPAANFYFQLELNGVPIAHVRSVSGLSMAWGMTENHESTNLGTQKLWDKGTPGDITLGQVIELSEGDSLLAEMEKLGAVQGPGVGFSVVGGAMCQYASNWVIRLLKRDGTAVASWTLYGWYPSRYEPINGLEAQGGDVGLRTLVLKSQASIKAMPIEETVASWYNEQGLTDPAFLAWASSIFTVAPSRKHLVVSLYHTDQMPGVGTPDLRWKLFNCWPKELRYSDFDAGSPALATREIVLACDGFVQVKGAE
jgi:phage tail-like protein